MLAAVYKSPKKHETYLYVNKRDDFSRVPAALLASFGKPVFVMLLAIEKRQKLAAIDIQKLKKELAENGFYLQLPPPKDSLLKQHRANLGLDKTAGH